jgi:uncharacterized protein involved in exopolysaccharide biosynthesis
MSNLATTTAPRRNLVARENTQREKQRPPVPLVDYLRANRIRILRVSAVALVIAESVVGYSLLQPRQYLATATVTIPGAGSTPHEVGRVISRYRKAVGSRAAQAAAARAAGVPVNEVHEGVRVARAGTSRFVKVSYEGRHRADVSRITRAVAVAGLEELFKPAATAADDALTQAQTNLDAVQRDVAAFAAAHNIVGDPGQAYRQQVALLAGLEATGSNRRAIARRRADVAALEPVVAEFKPLQEKQAQFQRALNTAAAKRAEVQARLDESRAPSAVAVGNTHDATTALRLITTGSLTFFFFLPLLYATTAMWARFVAAGRQ